MPPPPESPPWLLSPNAGWDTPPQHSLDSCQVICIASMHVFPTTFSELSAWWEPVCGAWHKTSMWEILVKSVNEWMNNSSQRCMQLLDIEASISETLSLPHPLPSLLVVLLHGGCWLWEVTEKVRRKHRIQEDAFSLGHNFKSPILYYTSIVFGLLVTLVSMWVCVHMWAWRGNNLCQFLPTHI